MCLYSDIMYSKRNVKSHSLHISDVCDYIRRLISPDAKVLQILITLSYFFPLPCIEFHVLWDILNFR